MARRRLSRAADAPAGPRAADSARRRAAPCGIDDERCARRALDWPATMIVGRPPPRRADRRRAAHHLLVVRPRAVPSRPAACRRREQRQRQLGEHRQRGAGPRGHDVGRLPLPGVRPSVLRALGQDVDIRQARAPPPHSRRNAAFLRVASTSVQRISAARARGGARGCPRPSRGRRTLAGANASRRGRAASASSRWRRATSAGATTRVRFRRRWRRAAGRRRLPPPRSQRGRQRAARAGRGGEERASSAAERRHARGWRGVGHENAPGWSRFGLPDARAVSSTGFRIGPAPGPVTVLGRRQKQDGDRTPASAVDEQGSLSTIARRRAGLWITRRGYTRIRWSGRPDQRVRSRSSGGDADRGPVAALRPRRARRSWRESSTSTGSHGDYEPDVFPISWNADGAVVESFRAGLLPAGDRPATSS